MSQQNIGRYLAGLVSAVADLIVSTGQLVALLPNGPGKLGMQIAGLKKDARWFSRLAEQFGSNDRYARVVARNHLQAAGWVTGMFTTALMVSDAVGLFTNGRWGTGSAQLVQAGGVATMTNADIIAARVLTPAGRRLIERPAMQAAQSALARLAPAAAEWSGTVASGWVTAIGFAIYVVGEAAFYRLMDDHVSEWLRGGPFSGDQEEQTNELQNEGTAYIELVKAMTPVSFKRIPDQRVSQWLEKHDLTVWSNEAESILTFASPALAITGEPADIELEVTYEQRLYRILGMNPAGGMDTKTLATRSGRLGPSIEHRYDESRYAIDFMIGKGQLSTLVAHGEYERLVTRYTVKRLYLKFTLDVWQREKQVREHQTITHTLENLDVEWQH